MGNPEPGYWVHARSPDLRRWGPGLAWRWGCGKAGRWGICGGSSSRSYKPFPAPEGTLYKSSTNIHYTPAGLAVNQVKQNRDIKYRASAPLESAILVGGPWGAGGEEGRGPADASKGSGSWSRARGRAVGARSWGTREPRPEAGELDGVGWGVGVGKFGWAGSGRGSAGCGGVGGGGKGEALT